MQILSAAVAWRVYELTRDPLSLGLVGLADHREARCRRHPAGGGACPQA
jgi:hypothetical protein